MTKGKPWTVQEEKELKQLVEAKAPLGVMAERLGRRSDAISVKIKRLGLTNYRGIADTAIILPEELPSVEETLKIQAGAMKAATAPGLTKLEMQRLKLLTSIAKNYKEILEDYINYREIEAKLDATEEKHAKPPRG